MRIVGETRDDALGEAYDKVSTYLELGYPGGPVIDRLSLDGNPKAVSFPRPMMSSGDYNFSLSGLKTAVIRYVDGLKARGAQVPNADIAASFQAAALEVIVRKTVDAALDLGLYHVVAGGGVACNSALRSMLGDACESHGIELGSAFARVVHRQRRHDRGSGTAVIRCRLSRRPGYRCLSEPAFGRGGGPAGRLSTGDGRV